MAMKLLLVEDDENKRSRLLDFLRDGFPFIEVEVAQSLHSGVRLAREERPPLVLLDMTIPNFDIGPDEFGGQLHMFGGREFLRQMDRFDILGKVIVITQFETFGKPPNVISLVELDEELRREHGENYVGAVYYHASIDDWVTQLSNMITDTCKQVDPDATNSSC